MKRKTSFNHHLLGALGAAAVLALAACGGGGSSTPAPSTGGGTATIQSVSGTITGFGSVIIDGQRFDDSSASVTIDTDPTAPSAGTLSDLRLGMLVDGKLADVVVHAALFGPVGTLDVAASSFTLYGQTVKTVATGATPTVFEGVQDLAGLAAGDVVEVHGTVDAGKAITATRVERKPKAELDKGVRIGGVITMLDTNAKTFRFNEMTIDYHAATVLPDGTALADGQLVVAVGDTPPGVTGFHAKALKIVKPGEGTGLGIGGRITVFGSLADFTVSGVRVDATEATIEGGSAADLGAGVVVAADGTVTDGVLKARKLRILKTPADVLASLKGQVTDWVSASSFKLRGTTVDASAATVVGGTLADLGAGAWVIASGHVQGDVLKAERLEFIDLPAAQPVKLLGEVRDYSAEAKTFRFVGATVRLGEAVEFVGGSAANLANGRRVAVTGTPGADGVVVASRVEFLGELAPQLSVVGGRAFDVADGTFSLPGIGVRFDANTVFDGGSAADLVNGQSVLAKGRFDPTIHALRATWIEIVKAEANAPRVAGPIGDFVSVSDFRVGGQKVDASQASFADGEAASLANGAVVEAVGSLREVAGARVLVATKLRFLVK